MQIITATSMRFVKKQPLNQLKGKPTSYQKKRSWVENLPDTLIFKPGIFTDVLNEK